MKLRDLMALTQTPSCSCNIPKQPYLAKSMKIPISLSASKYP